VILTGNAIAHEVQVGNIVIEPFESAGINPNSYNYHLGSVVKTSPHLGLDATHPEEWICTEIPSAGLVFEPNRVYLGTTIERIGSDKFVPSLIGRSSLGRLGVFLQISADLGNLGAFHNWTLEIVVTQPIRLYAGMRCGQVTFWQPEGDIALYDGVMARHSDAHESIASAIFQQPVEIIS